jgi:UDP-N-acetyl-D-glucosamine dehydrogenase
VGIVGLGYVGLPLLVHAHKAGYPVVGVDTDEKRVLGLRRRRSYVVDVDDSALQDENAWRLSPGYDVLADCDVILVCVPTPLRDQQPDLQHVTAAAKGIASRLRPGTLVVLESTSYPGTTEELFRPALEQSGLIAGRDFALAYSPERIDPGRPIDHVTRTPKVVGGITRRCTALAARFYRTVLGDVHTVSSARQAEMTKLIENTFRNVNIALVNELAIVSRELDVDIWEAIHAAATKPFGFLPFWPGPGVGGHCIAVDPTYLSWRVCQQTGRRLSMVEHAQQINSGMPAYVTNRVSQALNSRGKALRGSRLMAVGVTYKADVNDCRESPSLLVMQRLSDAGAIVSSHDPFIPEVEIGRRTVRSRPLTSDELKRHDCVILLTVHAQIDVEHVVRHAQLVFDTRGVTRGFNAPNVVRL